MASFRTGRFRYYGVRVGLALLSGVVALGVMVPLTVLVLRPRVLDYVWEHLSDRDRKELYDRMISRSSGVYDAVPEPRVSRLAKPNITMLDYETEVVTNNAGLRSKKRYDPKPPGVFRIVCLGDSFVFGTGGLEEDRFCDQIGQFYTDHDLRAGGQTIETYALGIGGWNAEQETAYLVARISAYDPDVIVVLTVENDLMDAYGVTGFGGMTTEFTPQHRDRGSAFFTPQAGLDFGDGRFTALNSGLGSEARARWAALMTGMKRLSDLQHRRGKKILFSVLHFVDEYFTELYKHYFAESRIPDPMIATTYMFSVANAFLGPTTRLPHDPHPNRVGHGILASHYIHKLSALGWVPVPRSKLPVLHKGLTLETPEPNPARLRTYQKRFVANNLKESLDFSHLGRADVNAFLGGILPERKGPEGLNESPWATIRSGFMLRRPNSTASAVDIRIGIPSLPELFPFQVRVFIDGGPAQVFRFDEPQTYDVYDLNVSMPPRSTEEEPAIEIIMATDSYFTQIEDHRMKSFRLLSARVR